MRTLRPLLAALAACGRANKAVVSAANSKGAAKSPPLPGAGSPKPAAGDAAAGSDDLFKGFGFGQ